jgi:hypothetical protein
MGPISAVRQTARREVARQKRNFARPGLSAGKPCRYVSAPDPKRRRANLHWARPIQVFSITYLTVKLAMTVRLSSIERNMIDSDRSFA